MLLIGTQLLGVHIPLLISIETPYCKGWIKLLAILSELLFTLVSTPPKKTDKVRDDKH